MAVVSGRLKTCLVCFFSGEVKDALLRFVRISLLETVAWGVSC